MRHQRSLMSFFLKKDLQGRYVLSYFLFVMVGSIVFALVLGLFSADTLTIVYENHDLRLGQTPAILLTKVLGAQWAFIIFGGLLVVVGAIVLTHRVAGPMYRFESTLDEMIKGNIGINIILRKKDEGQELAAKINQFNSMLSTNVAEMKQIVEESEGVVEKLRVVLDKSDSDQELSVSLGRIVDLNRRQREILSGFSRKNE